MKRHLIPFLLLLLACGGVAAQAWPEKPVRMIVPFPAGGPTDVVGRIVAQRLSDKWKQPVVVENRPGGGANIGAEMAAKAPADGYTLLMTTSALVIAPILYPKLGFDPARDLMPVVSAAQTHMLLVVNPDLPVRSVKELIAYAKAHPGKLSFGSTGSGTPIHLAGELFKTSAGIDMVHVPYKGSAPALTDLMGGQVQLMFDSAITSLPLVRAGRLRALGISSPQRSAVAPDIPTIAESGVPGYEGTFWYGLFVPAGTPPAIIAKTNADVAALLAIPEVRTRLLELVAEPVGAPVEQFKAEIGRELPKWAAVIRASGAKVE